MRLPPANTQRCVRCNRRASDLHHRLPRSRGGPDDEFNCVYLCHADHMWAHANPLAAMAAGLTVSGFLTRGRYVGPNERYALHYNGVSAGDAA